MDAITWPYPWFYDTQVDVNAGENISSTSLELQHDVEFCGIRSRVSPQGCPTSHSKEKYVGEDSLFEEFFLLSKGKGLKEQSDENANVIRCDHVSLRYKYQPTVFLQPLA